MFWQQRCYAHNALKYRKTYKCHIFSELLLCLFIRQVGVFFIAKNKLTKPKLQFYSVHKPTKTTAAPC
ncbi:hypothetical protein HMPREF9144_2704 [Prevotella pallens ATCC 700821]|uniref:Uncharacterized protein n=1 Tax=Prevotella pallens ATCC 700821 TaxID=997353 RepID=F9DM12_9BACT|nr:hypothetical protein HMPREF9144_2704 [Prevotella pallens ATCC 700821]